MKYSDIEWEDGANYRLSQDLEYKRNKITLVFFPAENAYGIAGCNPSILGQRLTLFELLPILKEMEPTP